MMKNESNVMGTSEECLLCGAPLKYLEKAERMECVYCHRTFVADVCCENGHYVCDDCHTSGVDAIVHVCMDSRTKNPYEILERMMQMPFCHMHGPEHHAMVGAALLAAYHNAGGTVDLLQTLPEMVRRGRQIPGGVCGNWGACGAGISVGIFTALVTHSTPLTAEPWRLSNEATAQALTLISKYGGPRCCKRDSYLALQAGIAFAKAHWGVEMEGGKPHCHRMKQNNQCLLAACSFFKA